MSCPISPRTLTVLAFLAFISLGLPDTIMGVAWPSIRHSFGRPISDLGPILAFGAAGYLLSSFLGGEIVRRAGVGRLLMGSTLLVAIALAGIAIAPAWLALLPFAFVSGLGAGAIDAGINTFAAARFSPRVVNWLHACWGIGASISPLIMTAVVAGGRSWRIGYAIVACGMAVMFLLFVRTRDVWRIDSASTGADAAPEPTATIGQALRRPIVQEQMLFYFLYGGVEAGAGSWLFTLLTESRGFSIATAGMIVGAYWASLTIGRIAFGQAAARMSHLSVIRTGLVGALLATAFLAMQLPEAITIAAVLLLGFMLAPIFPTVISDTPARVGSFYAPQAVGFQVAGAAIGIAAIPGTIGVLARRSTIEVLPLCLLVSMVILIALHEAVVAGVKRTSKRGSERASEPTGRY
jgi:fucose permease